MVSTITADLIDLGFTVEVLGTGLQITKTGDNILSVRVESTDSSINHTCATIRDSATIFPVMSQYALVFLVVALLLAGLLMIRRKMAAAG